MLATSMRVLVIGSGGREHALVWKLRQSRLVTNIWCAPGNGGISQQAECLPTDLGNSSSLADLAENLRADLTVVGPEQPLVDGIVDEFNHRSLRIIGPSKKWAQLEGSKIFAKEFLDLHGIPTARVYGVFASAQDATKKLENSRYPLVLEKREFGEGGRRLLVEEALDGEELSFIVLSDGRDFVPLVPTRDHKRALDGDLGPNTGGMGAYSCDGIISDSIEAQTREG